MSGDILKNKILKIYNDYKDEFLKYMKILKRKTKKSYKKLLYYYKKIKENFLKKENRKKYLTTTGILIIINLLLINIYISFGYYYENASLSLIKATVGNMYLEEYDYVLLVYLENMDSTGNGNGKYRLGDEIPTLGYNYSGYKCQNNSTLIYDEETKTTSVTIEQKEVCSVYFDVIGSMDLSVQIMLEDNPGSNTYIVSERIPAYGYKYSYYECANDGTLEYNSELHTVKLSSSTKEHCSIYFTQEPSDIKVNLYVEETYQMGDYIERISIPSNINYVLNETKSVCINNNNERTDTDITYEDGYINIESSEIISCSIYLDKENE